MPCLAGRRLAAEVAHTTTVKCSAASGLLASTQIHGRRRLRCAVGGLMPRRERRNHRSECRPRRGEDLVAYLPRSPTRSAERRIQKEQYRPKDRFLWNSTQH